MKKKITTLFASWPLWKKIVFPVVIVLALVIIGASFWIGTIYRNAYDPAVDIIAKPSELIPIVSELPNIPDDEPIISEQVGIYEEEQHEADIYNIVLVGMDARKGQTTSRSDSIILLSYNADTHNIKLMSFMRDTWVALPEKGWQRINAATAYGGIGLLINTLNYNFDLDIQNYVMVKFDEFKDVIDLIGGVDIELTREEINYINGKLHSEDKNWKNDVKADPGMVHLNGAQALWHCRNRTIGDGDFSRTSRQRQVLTQIIKQGLEMDVTAMPGLLQELSEHVSMNLGSDLILKLASDAILHKDEISVELYNIPFEDTWSYASKNGASVLEVDLDVTTEKLHEILAQ